MNNTSITNITPDGEGFVKTATAAPDFELTELEGIPDNYNGPSVVKKDYTFETVMAVAGKATYIVVPPTAGVAYYTVANPPATGTPILDNTGMQPHYFPDASQMFPGVVSVVPVSNAVQLAKGRLMALSAELNCVNNAFNQYGTISAWKTPLARTTAPEDSSGFDYTDNLEITGTSGLTKVALDSQAYVQPVRKGVYSVSMNREEEFTFFPVLDDIHKTSGCNGRFVDEAGSATAKVAYVGCSPIWDNSFDSIIFRIDVPAGTVDQSFVLKIWKAWEYQPTFNSLLYNFSHLSPDVDLAALALYREMVRHIPMAVPDSDNPDFWNTVLDAVNTGSGLLSAVPGTIGMAGRGVHAVSNLISRVRQPRRSKNAKRIQPTKARPKKVVARKPKRPMPRARARR